MAVNVPSKPLVESSHPEPGSGHMPLLSHRRLRSQLESFVDAELRPDAARQIDEHLKSCWSCSSEVHVLRLIKAALARLA